MSVRITERVSAPFSGCRVDRERGIVYGALICGKSSLNGNDYGPEVWPPVIHKYEGLSIYLNHGRERKVEDKVGWFQGCKVVGGQPRGDAHFLLSHRATGPVLEAAERNPSMFGFSHVVDANTRRVGGRVKVESIVTPASVDLVVDPATTKGFWESIERGHVMSSASKATAVRLLEGLMTSAPGGLRGSLRKVLVELDARQHADAATRAFEQAGVAVWVSLLSGELDLNAALDKLRQLHKSFVAAGGSPADPNAPLPALESVTAGDFARSVTGRAAAGSGALLRENHAATDAKDFARSICN